MDAAKAAYYMLLDAEAKRAIDIDGVLVVKADYQGKIDVEKMTDHRTRKGFKWGIVGGAVLGIISRPRSLPVPWLSASPVPPSARSATRWPRARSRTSWPGSSRPAPRAFSLSSRSPRSISVKAEIPDAKVVKSAPVDDETAAAVKAAAVAAGDTSAS